MLSAVESKEVKEISGIISSSSKHKVDVGLLNTIPILERG